MCGDKFMIDTDIDDFGRDVIMARQNVDRRPAIEKVPGHLRGDLFGICADPFFGDTMISGEDEYQLGSKVRRNSLLNDGHSPRELLEASQASLRLCQ
jgi:hypothetical protein